MKNNTTLQESKILITGGAGYIGSHTLIELADANYDFIVYDNLSNSSSESLKRVSKIIGKSITFINGDIRDSAKLKAVGESVAKPLEYYDNNVMGTLRLLEVMSEFGCKKIVFSSSAKVYGDPATTPILESFPVGGIIGEDPNVAPNHQPLIANIGTGVGYSVLDVIKAFKAASKVDIPHKIVSRRAGDIAKCYADPCYAKEVLGWVATRDLKTMCSDAWKWQSNNPDGYKSAQDKKGLESKI